MSAVQTAKAVAEAKELFGPPAPKTAPLRLAARLAAAQAEIRVVEKKGVNQGQGYNYAREIDVLEQARAVLLKHGVVVFPAVPRVEFRAVPTRNGQSNITDVYPVFTVACTDTDERMECMWYGCGADTTDKGGNKAITASLKYFLIKLLLIPTGDADPDADSENDVTVKPKKESAVAEFDPPAAEASQVQDLVKLNLRRKEVMGRAMEVSDKTKEQVSDVLKKASAFEDNRSKPPKVRTFDGKTISEVTSVAWLDKTLNRLLDQLAKLEEDKPPF